MRRPLAFLLVMMTCLLLVYYTGTLAPQYGVILPETEVTIGGQVLSAAAAAARFEPVLSRGEAPSACYFEALPPERGRIAILYRFSWPDERHPIAPLDHLYRLWRLVYFGSRQDIEYVWVEADLATGRPVRLAFEAPGPGRVFVRHRFRMLDAFPTTGATHPLMDVVSWNHLLDTYSSRRWASGLIGSAPLTYLDDRTFRKLRIGRRSQPPIELLRT